MCQPGVFRTSYYIGTRDACRCYLHYFSHLDEVADGVFQFQHLAYIEIRSGPFELRLVGVVFQSHAEYGQCQVLHFFPFLPQETSAGGLVRFSSLYVEVD